MKKKRETTVLLYELLASLKQWRPGATDVFDYKGDFKSISRYRGVTKFSTLQAIVSSTETTGTSFLLKHALCFCVLSKKINSLLAV